MTLGQIKLNTIRFFFSLQNKFYELLKSYIAQNNSKTIMIYEIYQDISRSVRKGHQNLF